MACVGGGLHEAGLLVVGALFGSVGSLLGVGSVALESLQRFQIHEAESLLVSFLYFSSYHVHH